jgi:hypothetical protein
MLLQQEIQRSRDTESGKDDKEYQVHRSIACSRQQAIRLAD